MIRKILAVLVTLLALYCIKETVYIFLSKEAEVLSHKRQLLVIAFSITFPIVLIALWLWKPKGPEEDKLD